MSAAAAILLMSAARRAREEAEKPVYFNKELPPKTPKHITSDEDKEEVRRFFDSL